MSRNSKEKRKKKIAKKQQKRRSKRARVEANKLIIPTIYLDESGNTGHNIVDKNQPVFTLAGCKYSTTEAKKLLKLINSKSPVEAHFKDLKRRKSGQEGIISLMSNKLINRRQVKVNLFHKNFMTVAKIVDTLIEFMMHRDGYDLYRDGQNIALSNMLFYCLPTFCGEEPVQVMYKSFVTMIKEQTSESIEKFYQNVEALKSNLVQASFEDDINLILKTKEIIHDALDDIDKTSLDPSIPALFAQCVRWGDIHIKGFNIIHDDSHSIKKQEQLFAEFMDWTQDSLSAGYDTRKFNLPLKGKSLNFSNSQHHPQLQIADIVASSVAYWASGLSRETETTDYLFQELDKLNLNRLIGRDKVWPTQDVTPEALDTVYSGGNNIADQTAYYLMKVRANKVEI